MQFERQVIHFYWTPHDPCHSVDQGSSEERVLGVTDKAHQQQRTNVSWELIPTVISSYGTRKKYGGEGG